MCPGLIIQETLTSSGSPGKGLEGRDTPQPHNHVDCYLKSICLVLTIAPSVMTQSCSLCILYCSSAIYCPYYDSVIFPTCSFKLQIHTEKLKEFCSEHFCAHHLNSDSTQSYMLYDMSIPQNGLIMVLYIEMKSCLKNICDFHSPEKLHKFFTYQKFHIVIAASSPNCCRPFYHILPLLSHTVHFSVFQLCLTQSHA